MTFAAMMILVQFAFQPAPSHAACMGIEGDGSDTDAACYLAYGPDDELDETNDTLAKRAEWLAVEQASQ